jgi:hypothetical protein
MERETEIEKERDAFVGSEPEAQVLYRVMAMK